MEEKDSKDNLAFLQYLREIEKFPVEMEALRTTIESNNSTIELADETKKHFTTSKKSSNLALGISVGVSIITLLILTVQTLTIQKTKIENPIEIKQEQLEELLESHKENNNLLIKQLDSLKSEIKILRINLNLSLAKSIKNEKSNSKSNK